jgi:hypothetical protein
MNMVARSFDSAEEQVAFYRQLRARTRPQPAPPQHRILYAKPIGPETLYRVIYAKPIGPVRRGRTLYRHPIGPVFVLVRDVLDVATPQAIATPVLADQILRECAAEGCCTVQQLTGDYVGRAITRWRQKAMYRMNRELGWSTPRIGRKLGDRDHTTVMHGIRAHAARIADEAK